MTSGLKDNLIKRLITVDATTTSACQQNFADVPLALNVNPKEIFELLLHTPSANMCLAIQLED